MREQDVKRILSKASYWKELEKRPISQELAEVVTIELREEISLLGKFSVLKILTNYAKIIEQRREDATNKKDSKINRF